MGGRKRTQLWKVQEEVVAMRLYSQFTAKKVLILLSAFFSLLPAKAAELKLQHPGT